MHRQLPVDDKKSQRNKPSYQHGVVRTNNKVAAET
ncbi:hypothetical protein D046_9324, partial [Vibrio parahaemolyticus V-223/04]